MRTYADMEPEGIPAQATVGWFQPMSTGGGALPLRRNGEGIYPYILLHRDVFTDKNTNAA